MFSNQRTPHHLGACLHVTILVYAAGLWEHCYLIHTANPMPLRLPGRRISQGIDLLPFLDGGGDIMTAGLSTGLQYLGYALKFWRNSHIDDISARAAAQSLRTSSSWPNPVLELTLNWQRTQESGAEALPPARLWLLAQNDLLTVLLTSPTQIAIVIEKQLVALVPSQGMK